MEDFHRLGAIEIARGLREKKFSSLEVTKAHIQKIKEWNPKLNALVEERFEEAIEEAKEADRTIFADQVNWEKAPLFGVPCTIKEMISVKGMHLTTGAKYMKNHVSSTDATAVSRLRSAGAIIMGTTNIPEVGMWFECDNPVYGKTHNPYDLKRTPGGSSGGEGAIIASGASPFGLGSDIGGSLRMPAAFCGIFTHKPSEGVVPNTGHFPLFEEAIHEFVGADYPFVVIGPLARKAEDLYPLLKIISGPDEKDPVALKYRFPNLVKDWSKVKVFTLANPVIHGASETTPDLQQAVLNSAKYLEAIGVQSVQEIDPKIFIRAFDIWTGRSWAMENRDFSKQLNGGEKINYLKEFYNLMRGRRNFTLPALLTLIFDEGFRNPKLRDEFLKELEIVKKRLLEILGNDSILLMPPHPRVAPYLNSTLLRPFDFAYTAVLNALGNPASIAPTGLDEDGIPLSVQIVASPYQDHLCISVANELEKAFGGWQAPKAQ